MASCRPVAASQVSQNASPPMPQPLGMTTPSAALVAMAASTAEPPARRTESPASVARWCGATTAPRAPRTSGTGAHGRSPLMPGRVAETTHAARATDVVLLAPQLREREQRDQQHRQGGDEQAVDPAPVGRQPADERAGDLADGQEDAVEAHDRPAVGGEALRDVGEQAERGRRRPGEHEQADAAATPGQRQEEGQVGPSG